MKMNEVGSEHTLRIVFGITLATILLINGASAFGEVEYKGVKYFCMVGEPWTIIHTCVYIETDYTDSPTGLNLANVGDTFPGIKGADLIRNYLANPSIQNSLIGWSLPNQAQIQPGSAGPFNSNADIKCAYGELVHLAITWDGDIHSDLGPVTSPSISPLVNVNNTNANLMSTPSLAVELPLWDRGNFPNLGELRGHQILNICGRWVTDTNSEELWNELHPVTSLTILNPPNLTIDPSNMYVKPGYVGIYLVKITDRDSGTAADTFDNFLVSGLPSNWQTSFDKNKVTLNPGDSTTFNLSIKHGDSSTSSGNYIFTVTGESASARTNGFSRIGSASVTAHIPGFESIYSIMLFITIFYLHRKK